MRKFYIDLTIALVCIYIAFKYTTFFMILTAICLVVWFFVFDAQKRKEIVEKISKLYHR